MLPLLPLPPTHPLVQMFQVKTLNIFHSPSDNELGLCDRLLGEDLFPRSLWIMSLRAGVLYHMHGKMALHKTYLSVLLMLGPSQISRKPQTSSRRFLLSIPTA